MPHGQGVISPSKANRNQVFIYARDYSICILGLSNCDESWCALRLGIWVSDGCTMDCQAFSPSHGGVQCSWKGPSGLQCPDTILALLHQANGSSRREANELSLARNKGHLPCFMFGSGPSQTLDGYISRAIKRSLGPSVGTEALVSMLLHTASGHRQTTFGNAPSLMLNPQLHGIVQAGQSPGDCWQHTTTGDCPAVLRKMSGGCLVCQCCSRMSHSRIILSECAAALHQVLQLQIQPGK